VVDVATGSTSTSTSTRTSSTGSVRISGHAVAVGSDVRCCTVAVVPRIIIRKVQLWTPTNREINERREVSVTMVALYRMTFISSQVTHLAVFFMYSVHAASHTSRGPSHREHVPVKNQCLCVNKRVMRTKYTYGVSEHHVNNIRG
jgi:uncharacterized protein YsxB (DUF464 family)